MRAAILLLLIFITAGCVQTGEFIETTTTTTIELTDKCIGIICNNSTIICRDGFVASCSNICEDGTCTECTPDCTGHACSENWVCTGWSSCLDGKQTRTCNDTNSCGTEINKPKEIQNCVEEGNIVIDYIHYESPEWVRIANKGNTAIDMGSWSLNDVAGHIYIFPTGFILGPHESVRIHTEKGSDTETDLYMNKGRPVWNNDGDKATLRDEKGIIIDEYSYPIEEITTTTTTITTTTTTTIPEETTTTIPETTTTVPEATTTTIPETTTTIIPSINHLLISQVYYDTLGDDSDEEWGELYNPTAEAVDLTNYKLMDNRGSWNIAAGTIIASKGYLTIARNSEGFNSLYACNPDVSGLTLALANDGDQLILNDGSVDIDFVAWEGYVEEWDISADNDKSIKRIFERDTDSASDWLSDQLPEPANC